MIEFTDVSFTYVDAPRPTLSHVDLAIGEGELCLVVGPTGSGKSTLLRAINGLVPHFSGGHLAGEVTVAGRSTRRFEPRELADVVGFVGQNPAASFVTDVVEDELAYTMENLGVAPAAMRRRVEDTLELLGLHELRDRSLLSLSGGQQQRVAIGAVLTASPRVLVLDEPTSALDPAAAEEVLASLARLVHDVGLTVVVAEHRLERVLPFADSVVLVPGDGRALVRGTPGEVMAHAPVAPPIVELGRLAGWDPLPLSVRDARRLAAPLRERLAPLEPRLPDRDHRERAAGSRGGPGPGDGVVATTERLGVAYGEVVALDSVGLAVARGEVVALMGRNGSGKSTLLGQLAGQRRPSAGRVRVLGEDPAGLAPRHLITRVGLVPQDAGLLLYGESVGAECESADHDGGLAPGTAAATLERVLPSMPAHRHPRDLSEGQRLALALALVLAPAPPLVLLDEPTRGLDYPAKERLVGVLGDLSSSGHAIVVATHDVELVARVADRAVVLAAGDVVADGAAREVVCHSPVFAPQVAKVLAPEQWLTVDEVRRALQGAPP
ncbi:MAG: ABC transporter ATP-binding protein [Acidimicrobiales bacterium]